MDPSGRLFIATSSVQFLNLAIEEIKHLDSKATKFKVLQEGMFGFETSVDAGEFQFRVLQNEPIFIWHLFRVDVKYEVTEEIDVISPLYQWLKNYDYPLRAGEKVAVQVRKLMKDYPYSGSELKKQMDVWLEEIYQVKPTVKDSESIASIVVHGGWIYAGISRTHENLSDWAGGMIRFRREEEDISRVKFKLLEARDRFDINVHTVRKALDLGAAPGCWTQVLLDWGLNVTAVDTEEIDSRLIDKPGLQIVSENLFEYKPKSNDYDLLTCHMGWGAHQTVTILLKMSEALKKEGRLIVTLPLSHNQVTATIKRLTEQLSDSFEMIKAKHLFHNRREITFYMKKI
jgi:23S rRNA (cytidine2498-2'-O)-methyltransferase